MRPRTVQAWLPEHPPGPDQAPAHCARPRLSHVAVTSRGYPDVNSGQCWGPSLSWPRVRFAAHGLDRRGSVVALLAHLPWESKTQRSPPARLNHGESWAPSGCAFSPEQMGRRRVGGLVRAGRAPPPYKRSLCFPLPRLWLALWLLASSRFLLSVLLILSSL